MEEKRAKLGLIVNRRNLHKRKLVWDKFRLDFDFSFNF